MRLPDVVHGLDRNNRPLCGWKKRPILATHGRPTCELCRDVLRFRDQRSARIGLCESPAPDEPSNVGSDTIDAAAQPAAQTDQWRNWKELGRELRLLGRVVVLHLCMRVASICAARQGERREPLEPDETTGGCGPTPR